MALLWILLFSSFASWAPINRLAEKEVRYVIIEAECKSGFNALPEYSEKVLLTNVFKREYENAVEMVKAESALISEFEVALQASYPNQGNQVGEIMVYMLTTEKEAKDLHKRKTKLFKTLNKGVVELKL